MGCSRERSRDAGIAAGARDDAEIGRRLDEDDDRIGLGRLDDCSRRLA